MQLYICIRSQPIFLVSRKEKGIAALSPFSSGVLNGTMAILILSTVLL